MRALALGLLKSLWFYVLHVVVSNYCLQNLDVFCVEQVVKSPPPAWEAEYKAWTQLRQMNEQLIKQYPALVRA